MFAALLPSLHIESVMLEGAATWARTAALQPIRRRRTDGTSLYAGVSGAGQVRRGLKKRRIELASKLMQARRAVRSALRENDVAGLAEARASVDRAKVALGERGPVWWSDDAPDLNRRMVAGTPHAAWFAQPKV